MDLQQILGLIVSLVLLALLVVALIKKVSPALALLVCGLLGFAYYVISTGNSPMVANNLTSTGNVGFDIFAYTERIFVNLMGSNVLTLMAIMGYVGYVNHLKATTMLCLTLGHPLRKFKRPYVVVVMVILITVVLKFSILSIVSQMALVLVTLYPIMMMMGVSRATAASVLIFAGYINWGPANFFYILFSGLADTGIPVTEYFARFELPATLITLAVCLVVFFFTSKYFDKKEGAESGDSDILDKYKSPKDLGIPIFYGIFPLLPVILVLVFSGGAIPIKISVVTACIISWMFVFVVDIIRRKDRAQAMEDTMQFWKGAGSMIVATGGMIIAASVFSGAVEAMGGFSAAFTAILSGGGSITLIAIIGSIFGAVFLFLTGSVNGAMLLFGPLMATAAAADGGQYAFLQIIITLIPVVQIAGSIGIASPAVIYISGETKTPLITIIKRNIIPICVYIVLQIVLTQFVFWPMFVK